MEEGLMAAVVAALTSVITVFLSNKYKPKVEKEIQIQKVEIENTYEQIREIKKTLSQHKVHLINAAVSLKKRLKNLAKNYCKDLHSVNQDYLNINNYYFQSTVYRVLRLYAWIKVLEDRLIYLDTTLAVATPEDLYFIKYIKAIWSTLQETSLVSELDSEAKIEDDLIFRDTLDEMTMWMIEDGRVLSFSEFKSRLGENIDKVRRLCEFVEGVSPEEGRLRWDRLYCQRLLLTSFINSYGYDFQHDNRKAIIGYLDQMKKMEALTMLPNFIKYLDSYKLSAESNIKVLLKEMKGYVPKGSNEEME